MSTLLEAPLLGKEKRLVERGPEDEMEQREKLEAEGGSMDPERKADHWSTRTMLTKEASEEVKGAENEKQGVEVDDVIPRARKRMAAS